MRAYGGVEDTLLKGNEDGILNCRKKWNEMKSFCESQQWITCGNRREFPRPLVELNSNEIRFDFRKKDNNKWLSPSTP